MRNSADAKFGCNAWSSFLLFFSGLSIYGRPGGSIMLGYDGGVLKTNH